MPSFPRFILNSLIVVASACLIGALLSVLGWWMFSLFTSVGFGFAGMAVAASQLDENKRGTMFAIVASLIIVAGTAFMASFEIEHRPWPSKVSGISVEEAPSHPWANTFYFRDGRVLTDLEGSADIYGGSPKSAHAARVDVAYAVPVVPEGWT